MFHFILPRLHFSRIPFFFTHSLYIINPFSANCFYVTHRRRCAILLTQIRVSQRVSLYKDSLYKEMIELTRLHYRKEIATRSRDCFFREKFVQQLQSLF